MTSFLQLLSRSEIVDKGCDYMCIASQTTLAELKNSALFNCFVIDSKSGEYQIKMHSELPPRPPYMVGSEGDPHGTPELFRVLSSAPLAVGNRATIINLTSFAIKAPFPKFAAKQTNVDGYNVISPYFGAPSCRVGRLVAIAWLPKPPGATEVDHLDGDPSNDTLANLEWVSHALNIQRGRHTKRQNWGPKDQVLMIREGYAPKLVHPSEVTGIAGSRNTSHILRRGTRRSQNGWFLCLNPSRADALNFVDSLPFEDTSYYMAAVEELFDFLDID